MNRCVKPDVRFTGLTLITYEVCVYPPARVLNRASPGVGAMGLVVFTKDFEIRLTPTWTW